MPPRWRGWSRRARGRRPRRGRQDATVVSVVVNQHRPGVLFGRAASPDACRGRSLSPPATMDPEAARSLAVGSQRVGSISTRRSAAGAIERTRALTILTLGRRKRSSRQARPARRRWQPSSTSSATRRAGAAFKMINQLLWFTSPPPAEGDRLCRPPTRPAKGLRSSSASAETLDVRERVPHVLGGDYAPRSSVDPSS